MMAKVVAYEMDGGATASCGVASSPPWRKLVRVNRKLPIGFQWMSMPDLVAKVSGSGAQGLKGRAAAVRSKRPNGYSLEHSTRMTRLWLVVLVGGDALETGELELMVSSIAPCTRKR